MAKIDNVNAKKTDEEKILTKWQMGRKKFP